MAELADQPVDDRQVELWVSDWTDWGECSCIYTLVAAPNRSAPGSGLQHFQSAELEA